MATLNIGDSPHVFDGQPRQLPGGDGEYVGLPNEGARIENGRIIDGTVTMLYRMDDGVAFAQLHIENGAFVSRDDYMVSSETGLLHVMRPSLSGIIPASVEDPNSMASVLLRAYAEVLRNGSMSEEERDQLNLEFQILSAIGRESMITTTTHVAPDASTTVVTSLPGELVDFNLIDVDDTGAESLVTYRITADGALYILEDDEQFDPDAAPDHRLPSNLTNQLITLGEIINSDGFQSDVEAQSVQRAITNLQSAITI